MSKNDELVEVEDLIFHFQAKDYYCVFTEEDTFNEEAENKELV